MNLLCGGAGVGVGAEGGAERGAGAGAGEVGTGIELAKEQMHS